MLKREAIRSVNYLLHRGMISPSRMSFVLQSCNDVSVLDKNHNDPLYYHKGSTLYFDLKGHEISKAKFDRSQAIADAVEFALHTVA